MANLIDIFDKMRFWGEVDRKPLLQKVKLYGLVNKAVEITANIILPIYFLLSKNNPRYRLYTTDYNSKRPKIIVSLTSFPKRLHTLHLVIESLLRQTSKPDKIILYLTASQVPDIQKLPSKLQHLQKRGLEIVLCPDAIRSHTKYYYAFKTYPDDIIITVDDDLFYRSDLIETHLKNMKDNPGCIIANWVKKIIPGKNNYTEWPDARKDSIKSKNLLILGVGSVLYPPHTVHEDIFNIENIKKLALTADDIWISAMILKKGTPVLYSAYKYNYLPVRIKNNETLISGNYIRNQQCIDAINEYYNYYYAKRPFIDIPLENSAN